MQWFEESDELARAARFRDLTSPKRPDLSWARSADANSPSLKPPRLPNLDGAEGDSRELEPGFPLESMLPPAMGLDDLKHGLDSPPPRASEPPPRRMDTMIDDIVPRAEEEAFVAMRDAIARAEADREQQFADAEQRLVDLALLVARRVIAREVSLDPGLILGLVREGMSALGERDRVVVRVGSFFGDMREELEHKLGSAKLRCEVVVDPSLGRSGCVVETDLGRVDESLEGRLANLIDAMMAASKRTGTR